MTNNILHYGDHVISFNIDFCVIERRDGSVEVFHVKTGKGAMCIASDPTLTVGYVEEDGESGPCDEVTIMEF